jgi:hypothetical protein
MHGWIAASTVNSNAELKECSDEDTMIRRDATLPG